MALERHNPVDEFEAMFRRHLKQGGALVAPCVGFDADMASAYLEHVLDAHAQTRFEAHLAGCVACRRRVIELARLNDEVEAVATRPPIVVAEPVWSRLFGTVAQWLDLSGLKWGWTTAAATACSLVLTVLALGMWQRLTASQRSTAGIMAVVPDVQRGDLQAAPPSTAPVDNLSNPSAASLTEANQPQTAPAELLAVAKDKAASGGAVSLTPPPHLSSPFNTDLMAAAPQPEVKMLAAPLGNPDFGSQPPAPVSPGLVSTIGFRQIGQGLPLTTGFGNAQMVRTPLRITLQPSEIEKKEMVAELLPPVPESSPARDDAAKSSTSAKAATDPVAAARKRELTNVLKGRATGFMPFKSDDTRTKEADVKEAREQLKPLMQRLNGHTFYFEHGFWIDEEYKSDTTMPLVRLVRGSERYQQILIENPTLEQFFQLGQVIVVWKGKVYEVRK